MHISSYILIRLHKTINKEITLTIKEIDKRIASSFKKLDAAPADKALVLTEIIRSLIIYRRDLARDKAEYKRGYEVGYRRANR